MGASTFEVRKTNEINKKLQNVRQDELENFQSTEDK